MTLYMPQGLRWLGWVAGSTWPDGDEDAMWSIASDWKTAATALANLESEIVKAKQDTEQAYTAGSGADAMGAKFDDLISGDKSVQALAENLNAVYNSAFDMGTQLQATKITIILSLARLAMEIIWAWLFPPTAPAVEAAAVTTTRSILKTFEDYVQNAIERLAGELGASTMKSRYFWREMVTEGKLILPSAKGFGVYSVKALESAGTSALMDGSVQLGQIAAGKRHGFDWKEFGVAIAASAAGAVPGREVARYLGDGIDKALGKDLAKMNFKVGSFNYPVGAVVRGGSIGVISGAASSLFGDFVAAAAYGPSVFGSPVGWVGGMVRGGIVGAARGTFIQRTTPSENDIRTTAWAKSAPSNKVTRTSRPSPDSNGGGQGNTTSGGQRAGGATQDQDGRPMMSGANGSGQRGAGGTQDDTTQNNRATASGTNDDQRGSGGVRAGTQDQQQSSSAVRTGTQDQQQSSSGGVRSGTDDQQQSSSGGVRTGTQDQQGSTGAVRTGNAQGDDGSGAGGGRGRNESWLDMNDDSSSTGGRGQEGTGGVQRGGGAGQNETTAQGSRATGSGTGAGRPQTGGDGSSAVRKPGATQGSSGSSSTRAGAQGGQSSSGGVRAGSKGEKSWLDLSDDSTPAGGGGAGGNERSWLDLGDDDSSSPGTSGGGRGERSWLDMSEDGSSPVRNPAAGPGGAPGGGWAPRRPGRGRSDYGAAARWRRRRRDGSGRWRRGPECVPGTRQRYEVPGQGHRYEGQDPPQAGTRTGTAARTVRGPHRTQRRGLAARGCDGHERGHEFRRYGIARCHGFRRRGREQPRGHEPRRLRRRGDRSERHGPRRIGRHRVHAGGRQEHDNLKSRPISVCATASSPECDGLDGQLYR